MNPSLSISRSCAQRCCRSTALRQPFTQQQQILPHQLAFRSISSTSTQAYAQPAGLPPAIESSQTSTTPVKDDNTPFSHLQPSLNTDPTTTTTTNPKKNPSRLPQDQNQPPPSTLFVGTITRTGTMPQTVQITRNHQIYDPFIQKHYTRPLRLKAHDPHPPSYLREGDVVEYGTYTQAEKDTKLAKDLERIRREEERLTKIDKSGKAVRKFMRDEATKKYLKGKKSRGVQFVVRRVVTPFGVGLDERMERLGEGPEGIAQEGAAKGGQDSLLRSLGGNLSRQSGRAAVAG